MGITLVVSIPTVVVLPGPVGPEQPEDLSGLHGQVQLVDRPEVRLRVDLDQVGGADDALLDGRGRVVS